VRRFKYKKLKASNDCSACAVAAKPNNNPIAK
jgi:hypothetical protein